jgi:hypothetical protein
MRDSRKNLGRGSFPKADAVKISIGIFGGFGVESLADETNAMKAIGTQPNQTPEPTALLVTPRAGARVAPSNAVAHL